MAGRLFGMTGGEGSFAIAYLALSGGKRRYPNSAKASRARGMVTSMSASVWAV